jgi:hypothetical protein
MGELLDDSNQARGMALFGVIGGIGVHACSATKDTRSCVCAGRLVGPVIGGFFSLPSEKYLLFRHSHFFQRFPFFLPNLFVALVCVIVLTVASFGLKETFSGTSEAKSRGTIFRRDTTGREYRKLEEEEPHVELTVECTPDDDENCGDNDHEYAVL